MDNITFLLSFFNYITISFLSPTAFLELYPINKELSQLNHSWVDHPSFWFSSVAISLEVVICPPRDAVNDQGHKSFELACLQIDFFGCEGFVSDSIFPL